MEAIRMIGLLTASAASSGTDLGRHQSATNSSATSNEPTQAIYCPIGIIISRRTVTRGNAVIADSSLLLREAASTTFERGYCSAEQAFHVSYLCAV